MSFSKRLKIDRKRGSAMLIASMCRPQTVEERQNWSDLDYMGLKNSIGVLSNVTGSARSKHQPSLRFRIHHTKRRYRLQRAVLACLEMLALVAF